MRTQGRSSHQPQIPGPRVIAEVNRAPSSEIARHDPPNVFFSYPYHDYDHHHNASKELSRLQSALPWLLPPALLLPRSR